MDEDDFLDDPDLDTDIRVQGDRDTQTNEGSSRRVPLPFSPGDVFGEFRLEKLLGRGSSGAVFRGFDTVSRRTCALKILTATKQHDLRRNRIGFRRMMGVRHPNLMRVDQMHQVDDYLAMSMEEIHGETLSRSRKRIRKLQPHIAHNKLLSLTRDYAAGLAAIHANGLLHRDIKPSNLMVDRNDRGRIIDYGLVGTFDAELASKCYRDYIAGTFRYMSPEAYFDQKYTPAADIFSLGLVILEFLNSITGKREWSRSTEARDEDAMLINSAVGEMSESIPMVLREACLEMLQLNPGDRPTAMQVSRLGMPIGTSTIYMSGQRLVGRDKEFQSACQWLTKIYEGNQGRLHIHGESGIGKSSLADAIEQHLRSLNWGQVFRAKCRPRENQSLQTFAQIIDELTNRYASSDREPLQLDPASASIMHHLFPVLTDVVTADSRLPQPSPTVDRADVLQAAIDLSTELRKVGPLILMIDDVQWSDSDTNRVLDALQTCGGGMLGIITVSRKAESDQRQPPQKVIHLQPLSVDVGVQILGESARRWSINIEEESLRDLSEATGGNPFRLGELADEFRPGGVLNGHVDSQSPAAIVGNLDQLWRRRVTQLGDDARNVLALVATACCRVSTSQLAQLSELGDGVEIAVSELVRQRLIIDDATGGCCIEMAHDRVASGVVHWLSEPDKLTANMAWADLLRNNVDTSRLAGRIARHLLDAGKPEEAIEFAREAACDAAQSYAFGEAASWHIAVVDTCLAGNTEIYHLREAAKYFEKNEQPADAAATHKRLAEKTEEPFEQLHHRMMAASLLVQSGRFHAVRRELNQIAAELRLPSASESKSLVDSTMRLFQIPRKLFEPRPPRAQLKSRDPSRIEQSKLLFCKSLMQPMMIFDGEYAEDLFWSASKQIDRYGSRDDQIFLAIGSAALACRDSGTRRQRGEAQLRNVQATAIEIGPEMASEFWLAKALSRTLSMQWDGITDAVGELGAVDFSSESHHRGPDSRYANWLCISADWQLGDWDRMSRTARDMLDSALSRNDQLAHLLASSGFAAAAWMVRDRVDEWRVIQKRNNDCIGGTHTSGKPEIADLLSFIADSQIGLYSGDFSVVVSQAIGFAKQVATSKLGRFQLARVIANQFGALGSLHCNASTNASVWKDIAENCIRNLESEKLPYCILLANLYRGILAQQSGDDTTSKQRLVVAQQLAKETKLAPLQLAAEDALGFIENGEGQSTLRYRMQNCDVAHPDRFEYVYTVPLK